jgi:hypothetical protein
MNRLQAATAGLGLLIATISNASAGPSDNYVYFAIPGVTVFSFTSTTGIDAGGKKTGPLESGIDPKKGAFINVPADRKGSKEVAASFKKAVGSGQTLVCDSTKTFPDKLNFLVQGTMQIVTVVDNKNQVVTCDNVIVAQGHDSSSNNWWMGGPDMKGIHISFTGITFQKCTIKEKALPAEVIFTPATPCVNHFNISINPL